EAGDSAPEAGLKQLGVWPELQVADVRHGLLQRAKVLEHTRGQAARWKSAVMLEGKAFDILILMPILDAASMMIIRALQHLDDTYADGIGIPGSPDLQAGQYTVVLYDEAVPLERALAQFMDDNAANHTFVVCQLATRC